MAKINESSFRGDIEKEITTWTQTVCANDEEKEFNPKGDDPQEYSGFAIILGPWIVHMFEAEDPLMKRFVHKLYEKQTAKDSYY